MYKFFIGKKDLMMPGKATPSQNTEYLEALIPMASELFLQFQETLEKVSVHFMRGDSGRTCNYEAASGHIKQLLDVTQKAAVPVNNPLYPARISAR